MEPEYNHPLDAILWSARWVFLAAALLTVPIFLFSYVWMMRQLFESASPWVFLIVGLSQAFQALAIALALDNRWHQARSSKR